MRPSPDLGHDWRRLRVAGTLTALGDGVLAAALPLLAAATTRSPLTVAAVIAAHRLPALLAVLAEHEVFRRADHRTTIGGLGSLRAVAAATLGIAEVAGALSPGVLIAGAVLVGVAQALGDDATHAAAAVLVPTAEAGRAAGRLSVSGVGAEWLGLPLGAVLFAVATPLPLLLGVPAFALAGLLALSLRSPAGGPGSGPAPPGWWSAVPALLGDHRLRSVTTAGCLSGLATSAGVGVLVLLALDDLTLTPVGFGGLLALLAGATVLGASSAPGWPRGLQAGHALGASLAIAALGYASLAVLDSSLVVGAALALTSWATASAMVLGLAVLHGTAPGASGDAIRRAHHVAVAVSIPLGALGGGVAALAWGLRAPYLVGAVALGLAAVAAMPATSSSTQIRNNRLTSGPIRGAINA